MKKIVGYTTFLLLLLSIMTMLSAKTTAPQPKEKTMKLYYVYDGLCGWCYGFSGIMSEFAEKHQEELDFEVIAGGMVTGERIGEIGIAAGYIGEAYKQVEDHTGVKFGEAFLEGTLKEGTALFTSVPSAIALAVFKVQQPDKQIQFAARLLKSTYYDGNAPIDYVAYGKLAAEFGLDADDFVAKMETEEYEQLAEEQFKLANDWGVTGFPTLVLEYQNNLIIMAGGYMPAPQLEQQFIAAKEELGVPK